MASLNKVLLLGNLTRDPQAKALQQTGTPICDMGMAISRRYKTQTGEEREDVIFVDLTAYGHQADYCVKNMTKGATVYVEGHLRYDTWQDKDTGKNRSKLRVVVDTIFQLERKYPQGNDQPGYPAAGYGQPAYPSAYGQPVYPPTYGVQPQPPSSVPYPPPNAAFNQPYTSAPPPRQPMQTVQPKPPVQPQPAAQPQQQPAQSAQPTTSTQPPQQPAQPQPKVLEPDSPDDSPPPGNDEIADDLPF